MPQPESERIDEGAGMPRTWIQVVGNVRNFGARQKGRHEPWGFPGKMDDE